MDHSVAVGTAGSGLLLLAFFLALFGKLRIESRAYTAMNFAGAALSCYASYLIGYLPFVVLEGTWAAVALAGYARIALSEKRA